MKNKVESFTIKGLFSLLGTEQKLFTLTLLTTALSSLATLTLPIITKTLVDDFRDSKIDSSEIVYFVLLFICQLILTTFSLFAVSKVGLGVVSQLRKKLWGKILNLPIPYFDANYSGGIVSCVTNDTTMLRYLISDHLSGVISGSVTLVGGVAILIYLDWKMAISLLFILPILMYCLSPITRKMQRISARNQEEMGILSTIVEHAVSEIRLVKSFGGEELESRSGGKSIARLRLLGISEAVLSAVVSPITSSFFMLILIAVVSYGGLRVSNGELSVGSLVAFVMYMSQIAGPMNQIVSFVTHLKKTRGATERIFSILELDEENHDSGDGEMELDADIVFQNVSFSYESSGKIINDISFNIFAGKTTAFVGPSGGGKTTIFSLISRFYLPSSGEILYGSTPIGNIPLKLWRKNIGYVAQESPTIAGTVRENICYGVGNKSDSDVKAAAMVANADEFISNLSCGYETVVGERGIKLSGGQRQRLAIARAVLRNPNVLMLDEATSNLDSQSESAVQVALKGLTIARTTVVIAHRLSTIMDADQIIFVEAGRVTGNGSHEFLLKTHQKYRDFVQKQFSDYLPDLAEVNNI